MRADDRAPESPSHIPGPPLSLSVDSGLSSAKGLAELAHYQFAQDIPTLCNHNSRYAYVSRHPHVQERLDLVWWCLLPANSYGSAATTH